MEAPELLYVGASGPDRDWGGPAADVVDGAVAVDRLDEDPPDCLVVSVADAAWLDLLERTRSGWPTLPVVLVADGNEQSAACRAAAVAEGVELSSPAGLSEAIEAAVEAGESGRERRRSREQLATFFEYNPDPVVEYEFVDGEPVVRAVNRAFGEAFGYDRDRVVGEPMNDVIVPPEKADEAAALDERVADGVAVTAELSRETTGGQREFLFRNIPTETGAGADGYALYVDISDQKERERRLEAQNERLNDFATVVSHDLRGPISAMKNHLDIAQLTGDEDHVDDARAALDRMDELVGDLHQLARHGDDIGGTEPVALADLARRAWRHVATDDATLEVAADTRIEADAGRLTQLLENLYINAVEHNPDREVSVTVGTTDDGGGFFVADDGEGIPQSNRDSVFKSGYTTESNGTGYGLTIVRQVARAHGWDVAVSEGADGGARFEFRGVAFVDE